MNVEGILINKTPYKERDLIGKLLLRNGTLVTVYFYGGRGGGKKNKGSIIELGFMLNVQIATKRNATTSNIYSAKEHKLIWKSDKIRENFESFYLMCFFLEIISKVSFEADPGEEDENFKGIFSVLSNALFYLEDSLTKNVFDKELHLFLFLSKLMHSMGIYPNVDNCIFCDKVFDDEELIMFDHQNGGFSCHDCASKTDEFITGNKILFDELTQAKLLRLRLKSSKFNKYKEYLSVGEISRPNNIAVMNYMMSHFELHQDSIKSWGMVFI